MRVKDVLEFFNTARVPLSAEERGQMAERAYDYYGASGVIDKVEGYIFDGTYILVAEDGANLLSRSKPLAFLASGRFWVNNHAHILKPRWGGNEGFFASLLESQDYSLFVTGAAQPKLTMENLGRFKIAVPSIEEQRRIAKALNASCVVIDEAISAKRDQIKSLDGIRRDAIQIAVTRGLDMQTTLRPTGNAWITQVPERWGLLSLKRIAEIQSGLTLGKEYSDPVVERPYLRVANVQDGHLDLTEVTTVEVPLSVAQRVSLRVGDVLMTEGGDLDKLGRGTLWNGEVPDCLHQNHVFAVRCFGHKLIPAFLAYLTASQYGRDYFEATGKKTTNLAATNSTKVGQFPIPLPPVDEQGAICAYLDEKLTHLRQITDCIRGQIETLTAYRRSLIHEYVTGQRRVPVEQTEKAVAYG